MARSKSSKQWLKEHFDDVFVKKAQAAGYRSRAVYKLLELQQKDRVIKPGMTVVDLGAAPGGWSQIAAEWVKPRGQIIALDILPMEPLPGVEIITGDFTSDEVLQQLLTQLHGLQVDVVLSDMAPNMSGMAAVDQPRAMYLVELALDFASQQLKPGGSFVVKMFHGQGSEAFIKQLRQVFNKVVIRKPEASRNRSAEVYIVAMGKRNS
ncbi:MAG: 23S rRNA (uridine(2552)-2'-O)-methyltransferase RlmE [Gammaproteobacteria bacterium]